MHAQLDHFRAGRGEPLVLLHGAEMSWRMWKPVLEALTDDYEVYAPTFPGHRGSPDLRGPVKVETFADAVESYLDEAGLSRVHLAGSSLGGMVTLELVRRGRALSGVDFGGSIAFKSGAEVQRLLKLLDANDRWKHLQFLLALGRYSPRLRRVFLRLNMVHGDRLCRSEYEDMLESSRYANIAGPFVRHLAAGNFAEPIDPGDVPVTLAWGEKEQQAPVEGYAIPTQAHVKGAQLEVMPDTGHIPTWDNPAGVIDVIKRTTARAT